MTLRACGREKELAEMLRAGHWPAACGDELREHVRGCRKCGDLVLVGEAIGQAKAGAMGARMDAAGVIWWRAQLRRKTQTMQAISRPLLGAQVFAMLLCGAALAGLLAMELRQHALERAAASLGHVGGGWMQSLGSAWLQTGGGMALVVAGGMAVMAGGFAVYMLLDR